MRRPMPPTASASLVRQAIQKLSADSGIRRSAERRPVHRQFVRMAASHPWRQCIVDANAARPVMKYGEVLAAAKSITAVSDRESDIYEHFARRPANVQLIVRACQNRRIETDSEDPISLLFPYIDSQAEQGRVTVKIPAAPGRKARTAAHCRRSTQPSGMSPANLARSHASSSAPSGSRQWLHPKATTIANRTGPR